jgi:hypothetical protein
MKRHTLNVTEETYLTLHGLRIDRVRALGRTLTMDEVLRELLQKTIERPAASKKGKAR